MEKVTVAWLDENKSAILCTYTQDGWTWEDFFHAIKMQRELIDSVDRPKVDVVVDVRNSSWLPKGGSILSGMRKFTSEKHPRQGQTIIVGARGMVASIARAVIGLLGSARQEMHFAETMDEARQKIRDFESRRQEEVKKAS
jgi:hypothetical protein